MTKNEASDLLAALRGGYELSPQIIRTALYATGDLGIRWTLDTIRARCDEEGDCWLWAHSLNGSGYPQATVNGKRGASVRRLCFTLAYGEIKPGNRVRPSCHKRDCVSPLCLEQLSKGEALKASYAAGERETMEVFSGRRRAVLKRSHVVLNQQRAEELRRTTGTHEAVAKQFGVSKTTVSAIKRGLFWKPSAVGSSVFSWRP